MELLKVSLRDDVRSLRATLADRDATIAALQSEVQVLQDDYDALEQYGRRNGLRISGIPEQDNEDTTTAIVNLANDVLKVEPPLQRDDINISHRLRKPRRPHEPAPVIVRFLRRTDRNRVISERNNLRTTRRIVILRFMLMRTIPHDEPNYLPKWEHSRKRDSWNKPGHIMATSR